jgi:predicted RNase H-like nuclease
MTMSESGVVLGVDVGWSEKKKTTGVCLLRWDARSVTLECKRIGTDPVQRQKDLRDLVKDGKMLAFAIDGPIRKELDEIGIYRDAEQMLTRKFQERIGKPGQSSSGNGRKLNRAASEVAQSVVEMACVAEACYTAAIHRYAIAEAFPTSFLGVMLDEGQVPVAGARSDVYFEHLLGPDLRRPHIPERNRLLGLVQDLLPDRTVGNHLAEVKHHEDRAAVICAITALCVVAKRYVAVGDKRNGYIILPPRVQAGNPGLQPWAWELLWANRPTGSEIPIVCEPEAEPRSRLPDLNKNEHPDTA